MITLTAEQLAQQDLARAIATVLHEDEGAVAEAVQALKLKPTAEAWAHAAGAMVNVLLAYDAGLTFAPPRPLLSHNGDHQAEKKKPRAKRKNKRKTEPLATVKLQKLYNCKTCGAGPFNGRGELIAHQKAEHSA